ncbi:MAG: hypothetical protein Q9202_006700 [Teloschistes flavicans]
MDPSQATKDPTIRPTYTSSQIYEYLASIHQPAHVPSSSSLSLEYLTTLQRHHLATYPFENLSIHYSPTHSVSLDLDVLYDKFIRKRRGGYCMEQNAFFGTVLRSLGSHMINLITIASRKYMVDVGFGGDGATAPIPLEDGTVHLRISPSEMRLVESAIPEHTDRTQRVWIYQVRSSPESAWSPVYSFTETEFFSQDYEMMNFWTSTSRQCFFTYAILLAKMVMGERGQLVGNVTMMNGEAKRRIGGQVLESRTCRSEKERLEVLREWFGLVLTEEEERAIRGTVTELKG